MRLRWLLAVLFMLLLNGCTAEIHPSPPQAVQGTLDCTSWNFAADGTVPLSGEWAFYWHKLYSPGDLTSNPPAPVWVQVPDIWNHYHIGGGSLPGTGYATYRLHVLVKDPDQMLALKIPYASTAYRLWINGKPVAANGSVGTDKHRSQPQYMNQIISFRGNADLVIQVSNFQHRRGGLFQPLTIGTTAQIVRAMNLHEAGQLFLFGGLFTIGIYYLVLFQFRRRANYHFYFGLICLCLAVHNLCEGEVMFTQFFPHFDWQILLKIEYITADIAKILLFPLFFQSLFPKLLHRQVLPVTITLSFLFMLTALLTPASFFTNYYYFGNIADTLLMIYLWFRLLKALHQRRDGAKVTFVCFTVFIITVFNDILYAMGVVRTGYYLEWGLDFYIFGQALLLAIHFSKSFSLAEKLSGELKYLNQTLEDKVHRRTEKLHLTNQQLKDTNTQLVLKNEQIREYEQSRKQLLTNISHELRTPITLIQGYLEALIYDVIQDSTKRQQHMVQIHSKTIQLNHLIEDLFELSRLDVKQSSFALKPIPLQPWADEWLSRCSKDVEQNKIRFLSQNQLNTTGRLCIDKTRIDQVISNLVYNAIKFSPAGGTLTITVDTVPVEGKPKAASNEMRRKNQDVRIQIADNGPGIPENDLPYIFERFYKSKKKLAAQGTGLGLAISKAIVEQHGGSIGVKSKEGEGCLFYFTLPLYASH